jgi:hypothetical protein
MLSASRGKKMSAPILIFESLYAEIERLKAYEAVIIEAYEAKLREKDKLITKLADALDRSDPIQISIQEVAALIQRAREATNGR